MLPVFKRVAVTALTALPLMLASVSAHSADLIVSAAASLTNAFKEVAQDFEAQHPDTKVLLNFAASDVLLQQIVKGAPADVFASADQDAMNKAETEKAVQVSSRKNFASNQIVLIVPADSTLGIQNLKDLLQPAVKRIAYGNPASVPVGRYTKAALEHENLWDAVSAKGIPAQNVRQSLDYVARGEVEAGFVFSTDAAVMPGKVKVAVRVPSTTPVTYPIAVTSASKQAAVANEFVNYVLSAKGQATLARYGFLKP
ncbi:molybdate ABC transporter substrate-binding protein [Glaciimonas sp. PCH181]|uniref:molybdate ABC transporter substrate-binding protein n=1 Tax=Glaciimonas sp. PCH181 TaxID=2133943 RepID=UPI000D3CF540|nr:molybdate ABC transporter substrate-binding protein [Glaciimonas sp. PCH181]PUA19921.1 molybdate ABC transporter substrate-binding protein [Glaciimonas sp. PCH181]